MRIPIPADVDRVAAEADAALRNRHITWSYHELAHYVVSLTGPGANWCVFATWASKQAGQTIRGEDLEQTANDILGSPAVRVALERAVVLGARHVGIDVSRVRDILRRTVDPAAAMRRASEAVGRGNVKVYAEIGRAFARWLAECGSEPAPDGPANARFRASLRDGEPPDGQRLLRDAFEAYGLARVAPGDDERHEWLLYANLCVGFHEQTRLQPEIAASLDAPIDAAAIKRRLVSLLVPGWWSRVRSLFARLVGRALPLDAALDELLRAVQAETRRAITAMLMTIHLPRGEVVRLGRDLRAEPGAHLRTLTNPRLVALLAQFDPRPGDASGSGAEDWASLPQRMHFISELFRGYQERPEMFDAPFGSEGGASEAGGTM